MPLSIIRGAQNGMVNISPFRLLCPHPEDTLSQPRPLVDRTQAVRLLKWQLILALVLSAFALPFGGVAMISVILGTGIAIAGSLYFALQAFRHAGATQASQIVRSFFRGEAGKFVITVLLFAAVFVWVKPLQAGWLMTGFILEQLVAWGVLLVGTAGKKQ